MPPANRSGRSVTVATLLLTPPFTDALRRELRRSTDQRVEAAEITRLLRETVLRPDCLD